MLEILSVCCYYSDTSASMVVGGMRLLARNQNEAPFACLSQALVQQDIEVKAAVMQFVNSMLMGVSDVNAHALLRSDLDNVLLGESYDKAVIQVDLETGLLLADIESNDPVDLSDDSVGGLNNNNRKSRVISTVISSTTKTASSATAVDGSSRVTSTNPIRSKLQQQAALAAANRDSTAGT